MRVAPDPDEQRDEDARGQRAGEDLARPVHIAPADGVGAGQLQSQPERAADNSDKAEEGSGAAHGGHAQAADKVAGKIGIRQRGRRVEQLHQAGNDERVDEQRFQYILIVLPDARFHCLFHRVFSFNKSPLIRAL